MAELDKTTSINIVRNCIVVTLPTEIMDSEIDALTAQVAEIAYDQNVRGAIFDFSMVPILDTYTLECLERITRMVKLLGHKVVWVGLRPGVVAALIDLDMYSVNVATAVNLDHGLDLLLN